MHNISGLWRPQDIGSRILQILVQLCGREAPFHQRSQTTLWSVWAGRTRRITASGRGFGCRQSWNGRRVRAERTVERIPGALPGKKERAAKGKSWVSKIAAAYTSMQ